ncbi:MAG: type II toxin-antitoxin system RelE/ParE family toxin, partial [Alphaproteobacteria bacterium]|nr:type II toxin-antitoxin system RelE/ParE family toxin [Alphaproteobacteria bacterium]
KGLEAFSQTGTTRGIQAAHARKFIMILVALDAAQGPPDSSSQACVFIPLKGKLTGHGSVWVNSNWRVPFRFIGTDTELVDCQDCH